MNEIYRLLSIAAKGGKVKSGEFSVMEAIKTKVCYLVLVSEDASQNTKKQFTDKASFRNIPVYLFGEKESLGRAIGKENRTSIGITDEGLAKAIIKKLGETT